MKIGILTFHSQTNYGGVLQAFATQTALETMGHEAVILDRWMSLDNQQLTGGYSSYTLKQWFGWSVKWLLGLGVGRQWLRYQRTQRFLETYLHRTLYHFYHWEDLHGQPLGVGGILVGSDQVWNATWWNAPEVYLLEGAPKEIPTIAYAASFGMRALPKEKLDLYRRGFQRFRAISVREAEGVKLVEERGAQATHVLDPTQLVPAQTWIEKLHLQTKQQPTLVCYFLSQDLESVWRDLEAFAKKHHCRVLFFKEAKITKPPLRFLSILSHELSLLRPFSPINLCWGQGPREFIQAFAQATWVLSDSFHALMFASIFNKNVRILRPLSVERLAMFARIEEFEQYASASIISDSVAEALNSFENDAPVTFDEIALEVQREASLVWLKQAVEKICVTSEKYMGGGSLLVNHNLLIFNNLLIGLSVFRQKGLFIVLHQEETSLDQVA